MESRFRKICFLIGGRTRAKLLVLLVMMIINALMEMAGIGAIPVFIFMISNPETLLQNRWVAPVARDLHIATAQQLMLWGFGFLAVLFVVKNAFLSLLISIKAKVTYQEQIRLGNRLFKAYMKARYPFFLNRNSAELLRNVNNETGTIIAGVIMPLLQIVMNGLILFMIVVLLLKTEPVITLLTFAVLGTVSFLFIHLNKKKDMAYGRQEQRERSRMNKIVLEGVAGIKDIKVLGREDSFLAQYGFSALQTAVAQRHKNILTELPRPLMEIIAVFTLLFISFMLLMTGRTTDSFVPVLALFGAATMRLLPTLRIIVSALTDIRYNLCAIDPVYNDLECLEKHPDRRLRADNTNSLEPYPFSCRMIFEDVSYAYPQGRQEAVRHIDLIIPKGAMIGLVGPSGAGKTTLVDILLGLLEPQQGRVLADNQNIFEDIRRWRMNLGYIPQTIYLSDDTIRRNIAFGLPDEYIDEVQLIRAVRSAQLEAFIQGLPGGLDTVVGERGIRLSGGQRQRIGIARALYNNPQILIMDEATSALDNITEQFIIEALETLRSDRTIIMIAHRLTTVRNCDVIYLLDDGFIVGHGGYEDLLKNSSAFRKMNLMGT
ncbi:MAG TPA: ABC transporter ATP-binding protein [Smithellaceae bacterium]|nr:ABC transporter ATP-binding protein [Smithellaceae bacterium]